MKDFEKKHIVSCKAMPGYRVYIKFKDGVEGIANLNDLVEKPAFREVWRKIEDFNDVRIDPITHTLIWIKYGKEVDLDPGGLREEVLENNKKQKP